MGLCDRTPGRVHPDTSAAPVKPTLSAGSARSIKAADYSGKLKESKLEYRLVLPTKRG